MPREGLTYRCSVCCEEYFGNGVKEAIEKFVL